MPDHVREEDNRPDQIRAYQTMLDKRLREVSEEILVAEKG